MADRDRLPVILGSFGERRLGPWLFGAVTVLAVVIGLVNYASTRSVQRDLAAAHEQEVYVVASNAHGGNIGECRLDVRVPGYPKTVTTEGPCAYVPSTTAPAFAWVSPAHRVSFEPPPNSFTQSARAVTSGILSLILGLLCFGTAAGVALFVRHRLRWRGYR